MSNRTINLNQLEPGSQYFIKGKLEYSRLAKKIDGEELVKDQERTRANGQIPIDVPYTKAVIYDAVAMQANPAQKSPVEIFAEESLYQSPSRPNTYKFTGYNKYNLPWIGVSTDGGKTVDQIIPEGELATDLNVILVMRIFKSKKANMNNGRVLDGVIVLDPIRYYGNKEDSLARYGITFNPLDPEELKALETRNTDNIEAPDLESQPTDTPFGTAPQNVPQNPFTNTPFGQSTQQPVYPNNGIQYNPNNK